MRQRLFVLTATVLAAAGALFVSGVAQSEGADARTVRPATEMTGSRMEDCPTNRYCLYDKPLYNKGSGNSAMWVVNDPQPALSPGGDRAESVTNQTRDPITLYEHFRYGRCVTIPAGQSVEDLDWYGLANSVSSVHRGDEFWCPTSGYIAG